MKISDTYKTQLQNVSYTPETAERVISVLENLPQSGDRTESSYQPLYDLLTELLSSSGQLDTIHKLCRKTYSTIDELFDTYLKEGCRSLDSDVGVISQINTDHSRYQIIASLSPDHQLNQFEANVSQTFLDDFQLTTMQNSTDIANVTEHPLSDVLRFTKWVSAPIWVNQTLYGTLEFFTTSPLSRSLNVNDQMFVEAIACSISHALEVAEIHRKVARQDAILNLFVKHTPAAIAMFDNEVRYLLASDRWLTDYAIQDQQIIGRSHYDVFPEIGDDWKAIHQRVLGGDVDKVEEAPFPRADGTMDWIRWEVRPWYENPEEIGGLIMFTEAITERKKAEMVLQEREEVFRSTFDYAAIGMALVSLTGEWIRVNSSVCEIVGYTEDELLLLTFQDITHPDDLESDLDKVNQLLEGKIQSYYMEKRYFHKLGHVVWVLLSVSLVRDRDGKALYFVSQIQNINDRKLAEEALEDRLREETEFQSLLKILHEITIELTTINDLDEFYKHAVNLGLERLGFERLGVLLYDKRTKKARGTYGTNANGELVAEHHLNFDPSELTSILTRALNEESRFVLDKNAKLYSDFELIGTGWNAVAVLWNGTENIGWLTADNGVHYSSAKNVMFDILSLYALTLGTLIVQKQTHLALQESEHRFRRAITDAPFPIMIHAEDGEILHLSNTWSHISGYSHEEIPTIRDWTEKAYGERKGVILDVIDTIYSKTEPHIGGEFTIHTKQGELRTWDFIASPLGTLPDGRRMVSSMAMDITSRKEAEDALIASESLLLTVLDNLPVGVWVVDQTGKILRANPTGKAIWAGVKYVDMESYGEYKGWWADSGKLIEPDEWGAARAITTGKSYLNEEIEIEAFDGTHRFVLHSAVPMYDEQENILGAVIVNQDITQLKQAEIRLQKTNDELQAANEEVQRFAYIVSHDLRSPLINLKGFSQLLEDSVKQITEMTVDVVDTLDEDNKEIWKTAMEEKIPTALRFINTSVDRMDGFTSAILKLSRLGRHQLTYQYVDVKDIVERITQSFAQQIFNDKTEITVGELPMLYVDRIAIDQILGNIINNALKYLDPERTGKINIYSEQDDRMITIFVQDNGRGIAEKDRDKVFAPFRRAGRPTNEGEGMGLAYVQALVKRLDGRIDFTSTPDNGTTFFVSLPMKGDDSS